jgi:hypothetical protein
MTTRATNLAVWKANFGVELDDVHDYLAKLSLDSVLLREMNIVDAQYANGFLR